jgi:hypothetical protein
MDDKNNMTKPEEGAILEQADYDARYAEVLEGSLNDIEAKKTRVYRPPNPPKPHKVERIAYIPPKNPDKPSDESRPAFLERQREKNKRLQERRKHRQTQIFIVTQSNLPPLDDKEIDEKKSDANAGKILSPLAQKPPCFNTCLFLSLMITGVGPLCYLAYYAFQYAKTRFHFFQPAKSSAAKGESINFEPRVKHI